MAGTEAIDPVDLLYYPITAALMSLAVFGLTVATVLAVLHRTRHPERRRGVSVERETMRMMAACFVAAAATGVLSAFRVLTDADPTVLDDSDRVIRIALIALRVFIIGGLIHALWDLREEAE